MILAVALLALITAIAVIVTEISDQRRLDTMQSTKILEHRAREATLEAELLYVRKGYLSGEMDYDTARDLVAAALDRYHRR